VGVRAQLRSKLLKASVRVKGFWARPPIVLKAFARVHRRIAGIFGTEVTIPRLPAKSALEVDLQRPFIEHPNPYGCEHCIQNRVIHRLYPSVGEQLIDLGLIDCIVRAENRRAETLGF
jgi:hypothetical protein